MSRLNDRLRERARKRLLDGEALLVVEDRDDPRRPRWEVLPDLVVHLRLDALVDELADETAGRGPCGGCGDQRRRGEADEDADRPAPLDALATAVIGRLLHADGSVLGMRDEDRGLDLHLLVLDELGERVEVLRRLVDVSVATDEHVGRCVTHDFVLSMS